MKPNYADLLKDIDGKAAEVKALFDASDVKDGLMADDEKERVKALNREIEQLEIRASDMKEFDGMRAANEARQARLKTPVGTVVHPGVGEGERRVRPISLGEQFVSSKDWNDYFAMVAPNGVVSERQRVQSPPFQVKGGFRALLTGDSATSGGAFVIPDQSGIYDPLGRAPLVMRDLISVRNTGSDLVEYVRQTSRVNAAATVAEATSSSGGSGAKPEGGFAFERVSTPVRTMAEWVAATKRALADAGQIRGIIDQELRGDLEQLLETQILNGDNVGENLEGLDTVSGTQDQAWSTNILTTTRKARTLVRLVGRAIPTAYVLNPADWETIDLLQDNEARYFFGGPSAMGTPRIWGLPVVECEAQAAGYGWVGDWKKIVLWDREQANISVSDAHADFFIRNLVAVLAEMRVALGVIRPSAFVEMDLTA